MLNNNNNNNVKDILYNEAFYRLSKGSFQFKEQKIKKRRLINRRQYNSLIFQDLKSSQIDLLIKFKALWWNNYTKTRLGAGGPDKQ